MHKSFYKKNETKVFGILAEKIILQLKFLIMSLYRYRPVTNRYQWLPNLTVTCVTLIFFIKL